ncbi:MAG: hypothetical protein Q9P14_07585 [candidate division KSB1 bacterium]|nr:hypothetical protein [candidate division KSB1 bacterium]
MWNRRYAIPLLTGWFLFMAAPRAQAQSLHVPPRQYLITVHYDLGMHCTGFDLSYCCILPPYNSILAQIVKTAGHPGELPVLLTEADLQERGWILWYEHENNTYSEGPKMLYWNVPVDVNGDGDLRDPNDSFANAYWSHLFTYEERPLRYMPYPTGKLTKRYLGRDLSIPQDHGPTGKPMSHGKLDYTGPDGTVLYTVTNDGMSETPLVLAMRSYWEALGLPLTAFYDGSIGNIREAREELLRPYQKAVVSLARWLDGNGDGIPQKSEVRIETDPRSREPVTFFGTNPIDVPGCDKCHASERANGKTYTLWKKEYLFWRNTFPNTTDYYASIKAASISLLEIHDRKHGTDFLAHYDPDNRTGASVTRLGRPPVRCQDCHADNIIGQLKSAKTAEGRPVSSLSAAIHLSHLRSVPDPDAHGRTASCQGCHPAHKQSGSLLEFPLGPSGHFKGGDIRNYRGGCFLGRDVHSNPAAKRVLGTRSHLNAIGRWLKDNVMADGRGLYCTNCHNLASRLLYKADTLKQVLTLEGRTLRNRSLEEILAAFRKMENGRYRDFSVEDFFDPKVTKTNARAVAAVWQDPPSDPYRVVDDGGDYWLAAGEPKCADCHEPPFVENMGGLYAPIDQVEKFSLMRYSKGHHGISCQSCHQSMHGMHPVAATGADPVTLEQARQLNPDGHVGPLRCGTCHVVDAEGVPTVFTPAMEAKF